MSDDLPESFADHPVSLAEIRSEKSQNGADWTPRDVLIDMLRLIDRGEIKPDALIVGWSKMGGSEADTEYRVSSPNPVITLGTLSRVLHRVQFNMDHA